jgi:hypothetical protein
MANVANRHPSFGDATPQLVYQVFTIMSRCGLQLAALTRGNVGI